MATGTNLSRKELGIASFNEALRNRGFSLNGSYVNNKTKVSVTCSNGHIVEISPSNFKKGRGCRYCSGKTKDFGAMSFYEVMEKSCEFKGHGKYVSASEKVEVTCKNDHVTTMTPTSIKRGIGCSVCAGNNPHKSKEDLLSLIHSIGYKVTSEYKGTHVNMGFICIVGHEFSMTPKNIKSGQRCSVCRGNLQKMAYINSILDNGNAIAVKFGIATSADARLRSLSANNKNVEIKRIGVWLFPSVEKCRKAEREVKSRLDTGVLSKIYMPDGHSETTSLKNIDEIIDIYVKNGGIRP